MFAMKAEHEFMHERAQKAEVSAAAGIHGRLTTREFKNYLLATIYATQCIVIIWKIIGEQSCTSLMNGPEIHWTRHEILSGNAIHQLTYESAWMKNESMCIKINYLKIWKEKML